MSRTAKIKRVPYVGGNSSGSNGPDVMWVVNMYEDGKLLESRDLPNKSLRYAEDCAENWENGLIKIEGSNNEKV